MEYKKPCFWKINFDFPICGIIFYLMLDFCTVNDTNCGRSDNNLCLFILDIFLWADE